MDFEYNDEQRMLADSVGRWLEGSYRFEDFRRYAADHRQAQANWGQLAELGVLSLNIAEADGGLGGGAVETLLVMQAFGRALVVDPFVGTAVDRRRVAQRRARMAPAQRTPAADRRGIAAGRAWRRSSRTAASTLRASRPQPDPPAISSFCPEGRPWSCMETRRMS